MKKVGTMISTKTRETKPDATTMKAIVQDAYGSADVLQFREISRPEIKDDEVLVRVQAAGLDRGVLHLMTGLPYLIRTAGGGFIKPKNPVRGMDVAGRVEAVGKNVTHFQPGDDVMGTCHGSFAEYASAKEAKLVRKPANLTFQQAAAIPTSGCTALQAVRDQGKVRSGQRVLIVGASGGVGTFAVQLAKALGADVTGACSTAKMDLVRSIGADHVVDYTREDYVRGEKPYDVIIDIGGHRTLAELRRALTREGTLVIVGGEDGGKWVGATVVRDFQALVISPFVKQTLRMFVAFPKQENLEFLTELLEAGKVTPVIDRTFPLDRAAEAIRYLEQGRTRGKVVITV
jgi:NADPH:quinone reductase-like Zn-dependent oxidoreductase